MYTLLMCWALKRLKKNNCGKLMWQFMNFKLSILIRVKCGSNAEAVNGMEFCVYGRGAFPDNGGVNL